VRGANATLDTKTLASIPWRTAVSESVRQHQPSRNRQLRQKRVASRRHQPRAEARRGAQRIA
jgi:hypothetical protein